MSKQEKHNGRDSLTDADDQPVTMRRGICSGCGLNVIDVRAGERCPKRWTCDLCGGDVQPAPSAR